MAMTEEQKAEKKAKFDSMKNLAVEAANAAQGGVAT